MKTAIMYAATPLERKNVIAYTERKYLETFGTVPGETSIYIYAEKEGKIVGSVGLDFCDGGGKMPLEHLYRINKELVPLPLTSSNGVQICRLIADDPLVSSLPLVYAGSMYALRRGKSYGWLNHSDPIHRVFTRKGLEFVPMPDAELILENVPAGDIPFYTTPPYAKCYIMPLHPATVVIRPRVEDLVRENLLVLSDDFC